MHTWLLHITVATFALTIDEPDLMLSEFVIFVVPCLNALQCLGAVELDQH